MVARTSPNLHYRIKRATEVEPFMDIAKSAVRPPSARLVRRRARGL